MADDSPTGNPALIRDGILPGRDSVLELYRANHWSRSEKPDALMAALAASHSLFTAWDGARLIGLGNAISDGHLVVYYPHLLVHPDAQGRGVGSALLRAMTAHYAGFHQHVIMADGDAIGFYEKLGFSPAGRTGSMCIHDGTGH
jgi:GNAT superfamily N-acetyltransferase